LKEEEKKELNLFEEPEPAQNTKQPRKGESEEKPEESDELTFFKQRWDDIVQKVKKKKIALGTFLASGTPSQISQDVLTISFAQANGFGMEMINKDTKTITDTLQEEFGKPYGLKCVIDETQETKTSPLPKEKRNAPQKVDAKHLYEREPIIKKIVETFEGEIVQD
jgi:hypothetical protein